MDDLQAIRLAKTEMREGYRAGDVGRIMALISDGFSEMPAGHASFWGAEAKAVFEHRLGELFSRYHAQLAVTIISIRVEGALAFDWGWHTLTLRPKQRKSRVIVQRKRYLEIWQKEAGGQWKIAIYIDNADVPPQMPPESVLRALNRPSRTRAPKRRTRRNRAISAP